MIFITGAAGKTGKAVLRKLSEHGRMVKALVFRPEQVQEVNALGAKEVVVGDLRNLDFIHTALKGVHSIYFICPNVHPEEISIGQAIIDAASAVRIKHFVYHSVLHPHIEAMPHHWKKLRVEERLFASGVPFTILQPAVYMQNILANWNNIINTGKYIIPYSVESRISFVDLEDVAQAAIIVLTDSYNGENRSAHVGATYELVGTPAMSQIDIASILSRFLSHPVIAESISCDTWEKRAINAGLSDYQVSTLVKMFNYYDRYGLVGNSQTLSWLLKRPPTSLDSFIERVVQHRLYYAL